MNEMTVTCYGAALYSKSDQFHGSADLCCFHDPASPLCGTPADRAEVLSSCCRELNHHIKAKICRSASDHVHRPSLAQPELYLIPVPCAKALLVLCIQQRRAFEFGISHDIRQLQSAAKGRLLLVRGAKMPTVAAETRQSCAPGEMVEGVQAILWRNGEWS